MKGIWLPIITPFKDDQIDLVSYKKMIDYYIEQGITGIIPMGTTGESPTILDYEKELLLYTSLEYVDGRVPVYFGHGGNATKKVIKGLKTLNKTGISGILSVSPYYNRPNQAGIYEHFKAINDSTNLDILMYNIPYRTGRSMTNETLFRLAELDNIIGVKDSSGDFNNTNELLMTRPQGFSVLSGEDVTLFSAMCLGGDGGVVASAHLNTAKYVAMYKAIQANNVQEAARIWKEIYPVIPYLFKEPNPAPIKYLLAKQGLIDSDKLRLPMTECSPEYKLVLDRF